jgi:hypothetical protein
MIQWTYISPLWKEYNFQIENWIITHTNMWDDYDAFISELSLHKKNTKQNDIPILCRTQYRNFKGNWRWYSF